MSVSYLPQSDNDKAVWLNNFATKIGNYATSVGVTTAEVTAVQKDAAMYQYIINLQEIYKQTLKTITGYKKLLKKSSNLEHMPATIPALPTLATAPATVPEGIFDRISRLAARIKASLNYTTLMGNDLGIVAPASTFDATTMQADLRVSLEAGRPHLRWTKSESDALDLYADRNDGAGFVWICRCLRNEYIDVTSLAAGKVIDEWSYKGMYVISDTPVGIMSSVVSVSVKKI